MNKLKNILHKFMNFMKYIMNNINQKNLRMNLDIKNNLKNFM